MASSGDYYDSYLQAYEERLRAHRERISGERGHNTFCLNVVSNAECSIDNDTLNFFCSEVRNNRDNCDFKLISLIRGLYINERHHNRNIQVESRMLDSLSHCAFWPCSIRFEQYKLLNNMCFWSENHILMLLSSFHLYNQFIEEVQNKDAGEGSTQRIAANHRDSTEFKLLRRYLRVHVEMGGMYECLSHVYLPYSMSALLNLIDFSSDAEIVADATTITDNMVSHLLLTTPLSGAGATFTASTRAFLRTRLRSTGHNINQLIRLLVGSAADDYGAAAISDFVLTTRYRPSEEAIGSLSQSGFQRLRMSHPVEETRGLYCEGLGAAEIEAVPLFWSAGLVTHPDFVSSSRRYQKAKDMLRNKTLWVLKYTGVHSVITSYPHFSKGQCYTGVDLNIYKDGGVVMTSFEDFNGRCVNFSQLPWCVNLEGLPIWSQSGQGSESIADFSIINTHSPCIKQRDNILVVTYVTPKILKNTLVVGSVFNHVVRFFWPRSFFDEETTSLASTTRSRSIFRGGSDTVWAAGAWWCGRKGGHYVGALCTRESSEDCRDSRDARLELFGQKGVAVRRRCSDHCHSWVVVAGTVSAKLPTLSAFMRSLEELSCVEGRDGGGYQFTVSRPGAADIVVEVSA